MKKTAALALTLLLMTGSAYAYENAAAGYSVKTKNPLVTVEGQKFYGYTDIKSNNLDFLKAEDAMAMHIVNYFNADEMEKVVGEKFSTAYFDAQYEKLVLLQRSELNIKTLPIPLMDFDKYGETENSTNIVLENYYLKKMIGDVERHISIEKYGKNKGITSTAYMKQAYNLTIARTTAISVNEKLYMLTTTESHPGYFLPEELKEEFKLDSEDSKKAKSDEGAVDVGVIGGEDGPTEIILKEYPIESDRDYNASEDVYVENDVGNPMNPIKTVGDLKKLFKIENVNPTELDQKLIKNFDKKHSKFVKSVKFSEPVGQSKKLSYYEAALKKDIVLPDDWFYAQTRVNDKDMDFNMTMSGSIPMMQKLATSFDVMSLHNIFFGLDDKTPLDVAKSEVGDKAADELVKNAKNVLANVDSMLMTGSITSNDKEFKQEIANMYAEPEGAEFAAKMFLDETFARLNGFSNEYFALEDYNYDVIVGKDKAKLDMNVGVGLFNELHFANNFRVTSSLDSAAFLWLLRNKKAEVQPEISKVVDQWQF